MKKYLYVFRGGEFPEGMSPEEMQQQMAKWTVWMQEVQAEGYPLQAEGKVAPDNSPAQGTNPDNN